MFKIIFYLIITIFILHFTLYYLNFDFDMTSFNYFKSNDKNNNTLPILNMNELNKLNESINESINELKTLNECINNGQVNTSFS
jgi:hypothetical protein